MTETAWEAIGRVAKARRERLGLNQDELAQYGGPRVSTVGKFERASQSNFPLRTQHQMEKALGWRRGLIEEFVAAHEDGELGDAMMREWEMDLIEDDVPDMSEPGYDPDDHDDPMFHTRISSVSAIMRLIQVERRDLALQAAISAMLTYLTGEGAEQLGKSLRAAFPPPGPVSDPVDTDGLALAADEQDEWAGEQEKHHET